MLLNASVVFYIDTNLSFIERWIPLPREVLQWKQEIALLYPHGYLHLLLEILSSFGGLISSVHGHVPNVYLQLEYISWNLEANIPLMVWHLQLYI